MYGEITANCPLCNTEIKVGELDYMTGQPYFEEDYIVCCPSCGWYHVISWSVKLVPLSAEEINDLREDCEEDDDE